MWIGFILGGLIVQAVIFWFVHTEHTYYFWDSLTHFDQYRSFLFVWNQFAESIRYQDHSVLIVTPLLLFRWLFGTSRLAYVELLYLLYMLPGMVMLAKIIFLSNEKQKKKLSAWDLSVMVLGLWLSPMALRFLLGGLPDHFALLIAVLLLVIQFPVLFDIRKFTWGRAIFFGVAAAIGAAFRSTFIYFLLADALGIILLCCSSMIVQPRKRKATAMTFGKFILSAVICVILLRMVGGVIWSRLFINYRDMYQAYAQGGGILQWIVTGSLCRNGLVWSAVYGIAILVNIVFPGKTHLGWFFTLLAVMPYLLVAFVQQPDHHHVSLSFPGLVLCLYRAVLLAKGRWRNQQVWRIVSILAVVGMLSIFFVSYTTFGRDSLGRWVFPLDRFLPEQRKDISAMQSLIKVLYDRWKLDTSTAVYTLSCSGILNDDLLFDACITNGYPRAFCKAVVLPIACVDGRDPFPKYFFDASYVLVGEKERYHLLPSYQRIIGVLAEEFTAPSGRLLPYYEPISTFSFGIDTTVWLYKRTTPVPWTMRECLEQTYRYHEK